MVNYSSYMVAIIIVNYRRAIDTIECLESLWAVTEPRFHVFLADNGSGVNDTEALAIYSIEHAERLTFIAYPENYGFTGAHNRMLQFLLDDKRFGYVLLLNNDTVVTPGFLAAMLRAIDGSQHIEMVAAKLLKHDDPTQIDSLGITFYKSGLASNRKSPNDPLLGPTGGCALYTMNLLRQLQQQTNELFDEQFFCYAEDTDLAWRAVLLGYRAAYAGDACVYHKGSVSSGGPNSDFVLYHGIRNSLWVLIKDVPVRLILPNLGWILLMQIAIVLRYFVKRKLRVIWRLYRDFFRGMPLMWRRRRGLYAQELKSGAEMQQLVARSFYEAGYVRQALGELWSLN
ncbi:MAG: glycosyltransferase family 2 protein [Gammaproteobacteria bacterium]|nr:glycosyltransferase family 2 protein [Gammaproteobacteria bacterium]